MEVSETIEPRADVPCIRANGTSASGWTCTTSRWASTSDDGGYNARARAQHTSTGGYVWASFYAYDELLVVCDNFPNGHSTHAYIRIENTVVFGPYKSSGGNCVTHELGVSGDIGEGVTIHVWVRTSGADVAVGNLNSAVGTS